MHCYVYYWYVLLCMLLVCIHDYLKSVLRYTFLIWLPTNWTLYLCEQGCDYFLKPKGVSEQKHWQMLF